ncbi:MAG: hypothetical protein JNK48_14510 [Bryobacterales bacterium]|nr:hypothetical protein [Bryobacterales bacterium]
MKTQPVHTVYGGAHLFRHDVGGKLGKIALASLEQHRVLLPAGAEAMERVEAKLRRAPVEDFRIDFEDGYGYRSDEEEDGHARRAAEELERGMGEGTLPAFTGIRIKSFHPHARHRSMRTLRVFFESLRDTPEGFCVTLPKVVRAEDAAALAAALDDLNARAAIELMIETPEALRDVRAIAQAAGDRLRGAHFGPYDFCSACGVTVNDLRHRLCIHARNEMLISLAGTGIWLSDGPTSLLPVGSAEEVGAAWRLSWRNISEALADGIVQGWDLHPAQLPVRYAAVFSYFRELLPSALARYRNFVQQSEQATRVGTAFDDAATVQILKNLFERAAACGAADAGELP